MSQTILFIDGENFLHKVEEVLAKEKQTASLINAASIDVGHLIKAVLPKHKIEKTRFYAAKLHFNEQTAKKSKALIAAQRKLRNLLVGQGIEFIIAGNVRAQAVGKKTVFREKGVDVRIAVDMVSLACANQLKTAILCSSDSDLQPAIGELKSRKVEVVYLGFESKPNKGLSYTCDRTVLFRDSEIVQACSGQ